MIHMVFLLTVFSLCTGTAAITASLFFHLQYKKRVIFWFALLLGMVQLLSAAHAVELYGEIIGNHFSFFARLLETAGYAVGLVSGPRFCFMLLGVSILKRSSAILNAVAILYIITAGVGLFTESVDSLLRLVAGIPLLFGTYLYLVGKTAFSLSQVGSVFLRKMVQYTFLLSLVVFPFSLLKYFRNVPYLPWHLENTIVLFLLLIVSIFFVVQYFNTPVFLENGILSSHFLEKFGISKREAEIIQSVVQGSSNSRIAEERFISVRTVESHLYNIFQKTGVKNRVQLINLLNTNKSG
ncbi:MAG: helix-turn-helix transcriptional regulator [Candidatus Pacearchaeota archaeon]|nr:helix-turn-helix transcriptional regulator [Candidatus Pacearchaeota archaeon]